MAWRAVALIAASLLFVSCGSTPKGQEVPVNQIAGGNVEGVSNLELAVPVTSAGKWWEEWQVIHSQDSPLPAPPVIDFSKEHVLLVGSQLGKGDYTMSVTDVSVAGSTARVTLQVQDFSNCPNAVYSIPFQALSVPPTVTKMSVSEHDQTQSCG